MPGMLSWPAARSVSAGAGCSTGRSALSLQVWILCNLFHQLPIRVLELRLDNERTQGHAQELRHIPCPAGEQVCVFGFELIPWDAVGHLHPPIVRIHMQPHRLIEVKEGMLGSIGWSVHGVYAPFNNGIQGKLQGKSIPVNKTLAIILP